MTMDIMSLNKSIEHGKDHRGPYRGSQRWDSSCRPNGGCPWCESSRLRYKRIADINEREMRDE